MPVEISKNFDLNGDTKIAIRRLTEVGRSAFSLTLRNILKKRGGRSLWKWQSGDSADSVSVNNVPGRSEIYVEMDAYSDSPDGPVFYPAIVEKRFRRVERTVELNQHYLLDQAEKSMVRDRTVALDG